MSYFPTGFTPVYVGQVANNLTGEHTAIMIKPLLHQEDENEECTWLKAFFSDFRRRLVNLLGFEFRAFSARKYDLESWSSDIFLNELTKIRHRPFLQYIEKIFKSAVCFY